jgi:hypothetical protein
VDAGKAVVVAVANPELVAFRLRCSSDTVDRLMRSVSAAQWTWPRLVALAALERDHFGTGALADALQAPFQGAPLSGDVNVDGKTLWCSASDFAHEMAEDLMTGGGLDAGEIQRLQRKSAHLRAALDRYDAAAVAALQRGIRA